MQVADLALQRNKYKHLSDEEWRWFLQQEEGRARTADKLPAFAAVEDWWYPVRLSCEQCSSEATARYKASLVSGETMADLTAGYGVDTYFLSGRFRQADYVEQDAELCRIAEHNFKVQSTQERSVAIHNCTAEEFLKTAGRYDLIYMDPARRDSHGGKVFRLKDCTPDAAALYPTLLTHLTEKGRIMLKLSPMLDITQALKELSEVSGLPSAVNWDVHVVAVRNEVKEVLLLSGGNGTVTAIDLDRAGQAFRFTREEEAESAVSYCPTDFSYLYEPNAAILKAGAFKLVGQRFGVQKLDVNTHLYGSKEYVADFPGRVWEIKEPSEVRMQESGAKQANVLCRNYPLTPEQLKKKLRLRDGGTAFVIGCRINGKPVILHAQRVFD